MKNKFFVSIFLMALFLTPIVFAAESEPAQAPAAGPTPAPTSNASNYERAIEYLQKDQFDPAIEFFQKSLQDEQDPLNQAKIYNLIGLAYLKQGTSIPSSIGSFEQAIRLDPKFAEAYFNIASAYAGPLNDPNKAVAYFKKTIEVDPEYSKAYFGLGWFSLIQTQDAEQALLYFQKTTEKYKDFAEAYYGVGLAYIQLRKPHMALGAVSQLRELKRDDLAQTLEKTIAEVTTPQEPTEGGAGGQQQTMSEGDASVPQQQQAPAGGGKSPFAAMKKAPKKH